MMRIFGFNWEVYTHMVMPAFAQWLIDGNEALVQQLYEQTRSAREEQMLPGTMRHLQSYARARAFVRQLPRGVHTSREYRKLCSAEQFTVQSDQYIHHHLPQLYQNPNALRVIWGAIVEEYCISWLALSENDSQPQDTDTTSSGEGTAVYSELMQLLHAAGLEALVQDAQQTDDTTVTDDISTTHNATLYANDAMEDDTIPWFDDDDDTGDAHRYAGPPGISIGRHPSSLRLRGWLATISVRSMVLFELLACGRRRLPFGYSEHEPFETFIGYLTPNEVWHLALCLRNVRAPDPDSAIEDYRRFQVEQASNTEYFSLLDEIPSEYTREFIRAVRAAASQGLGLICSTE